jgi:hypothetical protein
MMSALRMASVASCARLCASSKGSTAETGDVMVVVVVDRAASLEEPLVFRPQTILLAIVVVVITEEL